MTLMGKEHEGRKRASFLDPGCSNTFLESFVLYSVKIYCEKYLDQCVYTTEHSVLYLTGLMNQVFAFTSVILKIGLRKREVRAIEGKKVVFD